MLVSHTFNREFETYLKKFFHDKRTRYVQEGRRTELIDVLEEFCLRGGKRLRPQLMFLSYRLFGGKNEPACMRASVTVELVHAFLLIHDDIMDESPTRRGGPAVHKIFEEHYHSAQKGISMAILAGDLALVLSCEALVGEPFQGEVTADLASFVSSCVQETIAGQEFDLVHQEHRTNVLDEVTIREYYRLKTAEYSFVMPLHLGAFLAGCPKDACSHLEQLGRSLGIAFQIFDDLEDGDGIVLQERINARGLLETLYREVRRSARTLEDLGYDHTILDHIISRAGYLDGG